MFTPKSFVPDQPTGHPQQTAYTPKSFVPDIQQPTNSTTGNQQRLPGWFHVLFPMLTGTVGATLGTAGGIGAGALIPGADLTGAPEAALGYAGGVSGAGAGTALGQGTVNGLEKLLGGTAPTNLSGQLNSMKNAAGIGALSEAIGVPFAKGLGYLAHPIQPVIGYIDKQLAKSPATIDVMSQAPTSLTQQFRANNVPQYYAQGHGEAVVPALNSLLARISGMVSSRTPQFAADNLPDGSAMMTQDIAPGTLPIGQANSMRRSLDQMTYNPDPTIRLGGAEKPMAQDFSNLMRQSIHSNSPQSVNLANKYASMLYNIENLAPNLLSVLPRPASHALLTTMGLLGPKEIQKIIPPGGGYLKNVIPAAGIGMFNNEAGAYNNNQ